MRPYITEVVSRGLGEVELLHHTYEAWLTGREVLKATGRHLAHPALRRRIPALHVQLQVPACAPVCPAATCISAPLRARA